MMYNVVIKAREKHQVRKGAMVWGAATGWISLGME